MNKIKPGQRLALAACLSVLACAAHAQLYKWVGPDGKVHYTDTPPPKEAAKVERKSVSSGAQDVNLPYELAQAVRENPVTLYSTDKCDPCNSARSFLQTRGIPYTEKLIVTDEDQTRLKKLNDSTDLPQLRVGRKVEKGFEAGQWGSVLSNFGYPESNMLPRGYQFRAGEPLVPPKPAAAPAAKPAAAPVAERRPEPPRPAENNTNPSGIRF